MKRFLSNVTRSTALLGLLAALASSVQAERSGNKGGAQLAALQNVPLYFERFGTNNSGFRARGCNYEFRVSATEADIMLWKLQDEMPAQRIEREIQTTGNNLAGRAIRMKLVGANSSADLDGQAEMPGKISYLLGNDPQLWRKGIPTFAQVRVRGVYPGTDLVYYGNQQKLEYDFKLAPGADPGVIAFRVEGADHVRVNDAGELVLHLGNDSILQHRPVIYQTIDGKRRFIDGHYAVRDGRTVSFTVASYDKSLPLTIDPILSYSTYFGGNLGDLALAVKLDNAGNLYVAGETLSSQFPMPLPGGFDTSFGGGTINGDAFVAKFNPLASELLYFTYLGGRGNDGALDLAVNGGGDAFITGFTDSDNFPFKNAIQTRIFGEPTASGFYSDAFVAQLDPTGSSLVFSTFFGGENIDTAEAIAIDPAGNIYFGGFTSSTNFPAISPTNSLPGLNKPRGLNDAFIAKLGPGGSPLIYATYLGGTNIDVIQGIAADAHGFVYATGYTASTNFPTTAGAFGTTLNGSIKLPLLFDAFVTKISPTGDAMIYSTLLGGTNSDSGFRIAVDGQGNAFVTGGTRSVEFPNTITNIPELTIGFTNTHSSTYDAFLTKISPEGALLSSARFGGTNDDIGWDLALDALGNVFVVGTSVSTNYPSINATNWPVPVKNKRAFNRVFVTAFDKDLSRVLYSLQFGGSGDDSGYGIAVDPAGNAYVVGKTSSTNFPSAGPLQASLEGNNDTFLTKITLEPSLATSLVGREVQLQWRAFSPEYSIEVNTNSASPELWTPHPQEPILENGWHKLAIDATNQTGLFRLRRHE